MATRLSTIRIDPRFRGPPASGNGGYAAGLLAGFLGGSDVEVMLRLPPPLDRDLCVEEDGAGVRLLDGEALIASAVPAPLDLAVPAPPSLAEAVDVQAGYAGFSDHIFPGCFVCGPERAEGDGLRLFPGATGDKKGQVAAVWTPGEDLDDGAGHVAIPFLWAALDCPGYFAVKAEAGRAVLGRIGARIAQMPMLGQPLIATGWAIDHDGRKHRAGTALHTGDGDLIAAAAATWVSI